MTTVCVSKFKDEKTGKIVRYTLRDACGHIMISSPENLKDAIRHKRLTVDNLTLTSDGRLVDSNKKSMRINEYDIPSAEARLTPEQLGKDFLELVKCTMGMGDTLDDLACDVCAKTNYLDRYYKEVYADGYYKTIYTDNRKGAERVIAKSYTRLIETQPEEFVKCVACLFDEKYEPYLDIIETMKSEKVTNTNQSKTFVRTMNLWKYFLNIINAGMDSNAIKVEQDIRMKLIIPMAKSVLKSKQQ